MSTPQQTPAVQNSMTYEELVSRRLALPDVLKPPPRNQMRLRVRHGFQAVNQVLPAARVPSGLRTLRIGRFLQPPMLCYGWTVNVEQLVNIADSKGFLGAQTLDKSVKASARINLSDSQHLLHHVIRDNLGIDYITPEIRFVAPKVGDQECILCFSTSWNDVWDTEDENPPPEAVLKIMEYLGFQDAPKWYMDLEEGKWDFRTFRSVY
ncbi:hypothetical protein CPB84DRAFT_1851817 [Gymnopilus junonius]|uniref:Uncharacterized protein n=1 Tax=Gymnopilus junonius TaxID=109634 RepID=A0A9P5NBP7_GYMJU|nr:hypothetical protein CPB84DRAFT_1851817 [Gymnopilus junonius]